MSEIETESRMMEPGIEKLLAEWKNAQTPTETRCSFPPDADALKNIQSSSLESASLHAHLDHGAERSDMLHLSLSPVPFVGNLADADIFLLMINPSLGYADYGTNQNKAFQAALSRTLQQDFTGVEFPCFALDPNLWWSSWFNYYERLFRKTLWEHVKENGKISYLDALRHLSQRLAILELVPYYSSNADQLVEPFLGRLESANLARRAAKDLEKRSRDGTATVIVRWGVSRWKLDENSGVVVVKSRNGFGPARERVLQRLQVPRNEHTAEIDL